MLPCNTRACARLYPQPWLCTRSTESPLVETWPMTRSLWQRLWCCFLTPYYPSTDANILRISQQTPFFRHTGHFWLIAWTYWFLMIFEGRRCWGHGILVVLLLFEVFQPLQEWGLPPPPNIADGCSVMWARRPTGWLLCLFQYFKALSWMVLSPIMFPTNSRQPTCMVGVRTRSDEL